MQLSETAINILLGVLVVAVLGLNTFLRSRRTMKTPLGSAARILQAASYNEKMLENFGYNHRGGKLKTGAWKKAKDNLGYLPDDLRMMLAQAFEMAEEVNDRIEAAKKFKSDSYMAGIDVSKVKGPMSKVQEPLREWLQMNLANPEYQPKRRRGLFG